MRRHSLLLLLSAAVLGCSGPSSNGGAEIGFNSSSGPAAKEASSDSGASASGADWSAQGPADASGSGLLTADLPDDGRILFDGDRSRGGATAVSYSQSGNVRKWRQLKGQLSRAHPPQAVYGSVPAPAAGSLKPGAGVPNIPPGGAVRLSDYERFEQSMFTTVYPVLTRLGWRARAHRGTPAGMAPYRMTVHHTQGHMPRGEEETAREVRSIQAFHMGPERGWADIGYHFLIDGDGRVAEGRPTNVLGAHAGGANEGNIGISLMGNFDVEQPMPAQIDSLERLAAYLAMKYDIPVLRPGYLEGHYHHTETDCPGRYLKARLAELRAKIDQEEASMEKRGTPAASAELASFTPLVVSRSI